MEDFKMRVEPHQRVGVQQACFSMGIGWIEGGAKEIKGVPFTYLYCEADTLTWHAASDEDYYTTYDLPEITYNRLMFECDMLPSMGEKTPVYKGRVIQYIESHKRVVLSGPAKYILTTLYPLTAKSIADDRPLSEREKAFSENKDRENLEATKSREAESDKWKERGEELNAAINKLPSITRW